MHASIAFIFFVEIVVQSFEQIRSHASARYSLRTNDPYLISFDISLKDNRHQGVYLAEMEDEEGLKHLRISTPIGPATGIDSLRCLRFNWEQRTGFLAVSDLDGSPYLHLVENRPYPLLKAEDLDRVVNELAQLGDRLEQALSTGGDAF
jgi:hypothetical protein